MTKDDLIKKLQATEIIKIIDGDKVTGIWWAEKLPALLTLPVKKRRKRRVKA